MFWYQYPFLAKSSKYECKFFNGPKNRNRCINKKRRKVQIKNPNIGFIQKTLIYIIMLVGVFFLEYMFKSIFSWEKFYFVFFVSVVVSSYELISIFETFLS